MAFVSRRSRASVIQAMVTSLLVLATVSCTGSSEHVHGGFEIPAGEAVPSVQLVATADTIAGWNLHVITTNFAFAPQRAGREFVLGEGHAHLYVDGTKRDRLYGPWYHLADLTPGRHTIEVTLNSNNHAEYLLEGEAISDQVTIEVADDHPSHAAGEPSPADPNMSVRIRLDQDPVDGWNLFIETTGFTWAPEHAGSDTAESEGHAHLSIDGVKVARVYEPAVYLSSMDPGRHIVTVGLYGNNHEPYVFDNQPVAAEVSVEVAGQAPQPEKIIAIEVQGGAVEGGVRRAEVSQGDTIEIRVRSDSPDSVHLHGYDLTAAVNDSEPAVLNFTANISGVFEVELEQSGLLILELTVR